MGYPLRQETREAISMKQEPTNLTVEAQERQEIKCARTLIQNGIDWGYPHLIKRGNNALNRIRRNRLRRLLEVSLSSSDAMLIAERRTNFVEEIRRRNDNQTTTPMS